MDVNGRKEAAAKSKGSESLFPESAARVAVARLW
jgi:hypothetical protein